MARQGATKVSEKKLEGVKTITDLISKYKTVAVVNMKDLPARQLGAIRNKISEDIKIKMAQKSVIKRALKESKNAEVAKLEKYLGGMPALMFSNKDSFETFRLIKANRGAAAAKVGQISPKDIEVKAGPTSLTPGPSISTLGAAGLQAGVEAGKISIKQPRTIVKTGEVFKQNIIDVLNLLGIEPMTIGLNVVAVLEGNEIFENKVLDINIEEFKAKIATAHLDAFKLAIGLGLVTPETASFLITRAELEAKALAAGLAHSNTQ